MAVHSTGWDDGAFIQEFRRAVERLDSPSALARGKGEQSSSSDAFRQVRLSTSRDRA